MQKDNNEIVKELLNEFKLHRMAIMEMIGDLEKIKRNIDRLIPERLDSRYVRFFEEKVKSITGLFNSLLDMRKELSKNLKDEIELRRKVDAEAEGKDISDIIDIRKIADKIEGFKRKQDALKESAVKTAREETDQISKTIDVTKVSSGGN